MPARLFSASTELANKHKAKHFGDPWEPSLFQDIFEQTQIKEIEQIRSPFYDLGKARQLKEGEEAH